MITFVRSEYRMCRSAREGASRRSCGHTHTQANKQLYQRAASPPKRRRSSGVRELRRVAPRRDLVGEGRAVRLPPELDAGLRAARLLVEQQSLGETRAEPL